MRCLAMDDFLPACLTLFADLASSPIRLLRHFFTLWRTLRPHGHGSLASQQANRRAARRWSKLAGMLSSDLATTEILTMSQRFKPLSQRDMTLDQQRVAQAVATGPRGGLRGPFHALLRSPELADRVRHLGDYVRFESTVPAALRELAILLVARFWSAHYEWNAHRKHAVAAGLDPSVAEAIEAGRRPANLSGDETLVYDLVAQLLRDKDISDASFAGAKARFGERTVVELI